MSSNTQTKPAGLLDAGQHIRTISAVRFTITEPTKTNHLPHIDLLHTNQMPAEDQVGN